MEALLPLLFLLCPLGMVAMMWWMGRQMRGHQKPSEDTRATSREPTA